MTAQSATEPAEASASPTHPTRSMAALRARMRSGRGRSAGGARALVRRGSHLLVVLWLVSAGSFLMLSLLPGAPDWG